MLKDRDVFGPAVEDHQVKTAAAESRAAAVKSGMNQTSRRMSQLLQSCRSRFYLAGTKKDAC